jgi:hypothetical protein
MEPPIGVTGPAHFPTFSRAKTNGKMLPENIAVPSPMAAAGKASLPLPEEKRG